jgi:hypothetical protein
MEFPVTSFAFETKSKRLPASGSFGGRVCGHGLVEQETSKQTGSDLSLSLQPNAPSDTGGRIFIFCPWRAT